MSKTINASFLSYLAEPAITVAVLILITRIDGTVLAFTNWDSNIVYGGNTYLPSVSLSPSAVKTNANSTTDQLDIIAAIDSVYITEQDIEGGRYDFANVRVMRINPNNTAWGVIVDLVGTIGNIDFGEGQFQVAINSLGQQLSQQIGDIVTPICRVKQLGDSQCKVTIASFQFSRTVATVNVDNRTMTFADTHATGYYNYGMIRFKSTGLGGGLNHDINMEIKTSTLAGVINTIVLQEPMPFLVVAGDAVILEAGCDRKGSTCRTKFSNLVNFHGEPYVPGNDYLIQIGRPPG